MSLIRAQSATRGQDGFLRSRGLALLLMIVVSVMLGLIYAPLLMWLGQVTLHTTQLTAGAVLVLFSVVICLRETLDKVWVKPRLSNQGVGLLFLALLALWLVRHAKFPQLPLVVISFCFAFAAVISFLFGKLGVREFMPAIGGFLVFGLLVGLVPDLDWPLRTIAGRYAANMLAWLGAPVQLAITQNGPPQLLLQVNGQVFVVATECNGFGLLTSSALLATILAFHYRMPWVSKIGLWMFAVPVAITCNFLRIVSICLVAPHVHFPAGLIRDSYHVVHETLGTFFYYLGLGAIWFVASRHRPEKKSDAPSTSTPSPEISDTAPTPVP